jgi:uncharacterized repeat protein (TIGR01451 family)
MKLVVSETKTKMNSKKVSFKFLLQITAIAALSVFGLAKVHSAYASTSVCFSAVSGVDSSERSGACGNPPYSGSNSASVNVFNIGAAGGESMNWQVETGTIPSWLNVINQSGTSVSPGGITPSTPPPVFSVNTSNLSSTSATVVFDGCSILPDAQPCDAATKTAGTDFVTVTYSILSPCTINSFSADSTSIPYNTSTNLNWSVSSMCTSASINSSPVSPLNGSVALNGSQSTGNLTQNTQFTLCATGTYQSPACQPLPVNVGNPPPPASCVISVNSIYNGSSGNPPGNPYTYVITSNSAGSPASGSGSQSFTKAADNQTWTIAYTGGISSGVQYTGVDSNTPNSQSCSSSGGNITFTLDFVSSVSAPSNPIDTNNSCGAINLAWSAGQGADSYDIFRNGTQIVSHYAGTSYTDSSVAVGTAYTYTIRSYNQYGGNSGSVTFGPSPITASACEVNLSTSDKLLEAVQGQTYPYNSCVNSQGGNTSTINAGNTVTFRIDVCNTGTSTAQNVTVTDVLDSTYNHLTYAPGSSDTSPNSTSPGPGSGEQTLVWNLGNIGPGQNQTVIITAQTATTGSSAPTLPFSNTANISYTSTGSTSSMGGCVGSYANSSAPCSVTYNSLFQNGAKLPTQQEIAP